MDYASKFMQIALNLAKKHQGLTASNPSVGCVIVKNGKIISSAVTETGGRPHAESISLLSQSFFEGADLFVTLEPCSHFGQTPPCVLTIINSKIKRVFIGICDIDKRVNGEGIAALKQAKIEVIEGVMKREISEFYKPYLKAKSSGRPFVSAKIVCSLDGKVATRAHKSKWISCGKALEFTNFLRRKYCGILIGTETFKKDSPSLTCRSSGLEAFSPKKFLLSNSIKKCDEYEVLRGKFQDFLPYIHEKFSINHLLIEGGARVITSALEEGVIDELLIGFAPIFIGQDGKSCVLLSGIDELCDAKKFHLKESFQVGETSFLHFKKSFLL